MGLLLLQEVRQVGRDPSVGLQREFLVERYRFGQRYGRGGWWRVVPGHAWEYGRVG